MFNKKYNLVLVLGIWDVKCFVNHKFESNIILKSLILLTCSMCTLFIVTLLLISRELEDKMSDLHFGALKENPLFFTHC